MIKNARLLYSRLAYLVGVILLIPNTAFAAVFISEVAWMGSLESANHEWIELTNSGAAVNVDGWILSDTQNLRIELAGTIPANASVVLERTADVSAPGSAFLIYTGALVNTGTDLSLRDAAGQLVEQVSGGEGWDSIGGDNVTKETAQYSSRGWYTADATPGVYANAYEPPPENTADSEPAEGPTDDTSVPTQSDRKKSSETVPLVLPGIELQLDVAAQDIGYVNQTIAFAAKPSGIGKHLLDSLTFEWNFGDGFTAVGETPEHTFSYAGKYVVTVKAEYKRQIQVARHEITILPVKMSLTQNDQGDVQVHNDTQYELDISGYRVQGSKAFVFPERSIVLPNQTVTIPKQHLKGNFDPLTALYDTQGLFLASSISSFSNPPQPIVVQKTLSPTNNVVAASARAQPVSVQRQTNDNKSETVTQDPTPVLVKPALAAAVTNSDIGSQPSQSVPRNERLTYVAFCILILLGIFGVYLSQTRNELS